jgi:hypothetical protein
LGTGRNHFCRKVLATMLENPTEPAFRECHATLFLLPRQVACVNLVVHDFRQIGSYLGKVLLECFAHLAPTAAARSVAKLARGRRPRWMSGPSAARSASHRLALGTATSLPPNGLTIPSMRRSLGIEFDAGRQALGALRAASPSRRCALRRAQLPILRCRASVRLGEPDPYRPAMGRPLGKRASAASSTRANRSTRSPIACCRASARRVRLFGTDPARPCPASVAGAVRNRSAMAPS